MYREINTIGSALLSPVAEQTYFQVTSFLSSLTSSISSMATSTAWILHVEQPAFVDQQEDEHCAAIKAVAGIVGRQVLEQRPGDVIDAAGEP